MSERFTASNGWYIEDGRDVFDESGDYVTDINAQEIAVAVAEYASAVAMEKRDRELGRERVEGYPDYAVYPHPYPDTVTVLDEVTGVGIRCHKSERTAKTDSALVARAWFAAQEPPKPTYSVTLGKLSAEQRDALLEVSREWDSTYREEES